MRSSFTNSRFSVAVERSVGKSLAKSCRARSKNLPMVVPLGSVTSRRWPLPSHQLYTTSMGSLLMRSCSATHSRARRSRSAASRASRSASGRKLVSTPGSFVSLKRLPSGPGSAAAAVVGAAVAAAGAAAAAVAGGAARGTTAGAPPPSSSSSSLKDSTGRLRLSLAAAAALPAAAVAAAAAAAVAAAAAAADNTATPAAAASSRARRKSSIVTSPLAFSDAATSPSPVGAANLSAMAMGRRAAASAAALARSKSARSRSRWPASAAASGPALLPSAVNTPLPPAAAMARRHTHAASLTHVLPTTIGPPLVHHWSTNHVGSSATWTTRPLRVLASRRRGGAAKPSRHRRTPRAAGTPPRVRVCVRVRRCSLWRARHATCGSCCIGATVCVRVCVCVCVCVRWHLPLTSPHLTSPHPSSATPPRTPVHGPRPLRLTVASPKVDGGGSEARRRSTREALLPPDGVAAATVWLRSPRTPSSSGGGGAFFGGLDGVDGVGGGSVFSPRGTPPAAAATASPRAAMPSNPTWQVGGRPAPARAGRPAPPRAGVRPPGTNWVRQTMVFIIAACVGAVVFLSARTLWRRERKGVVPAVALAEGGGSVMDDASVPEFGQAAVDARLDRDATPAAGAAGVTTGNLRRGAGGASAGGVPGAGEVGLLGPKVTQRRKRRIILSDGGGRWNTGVWPGWGYDPDRITLNWAAAGVVVKKYCPTQCEFTRDQDDATADAVVMELVNHPKFGIGPEVPIPWPAKRANPRASPGQPRPTAMPAQLPLTVLFYFEAAQSYPQYTLLSDDVRAHVDISMTPSSDSRLPITLVCPWGHTVFDFLRRPPDKAPGRLLAYFNEHGIASEYRAFVDDLFSAAGDKLHSFIHRANRPMPLEAGGEPYQLETRLKYLGTYKFVLVTESIVEADWVEPDLSQVFLAGAVPVYIGTPNAQAFATGPRAMIHARDFPSGAALWQYLASFDDGVAGAEERYKEFFAWKAHAMAAFMQDESGQELAIGTGHGVALTLMEEPDLLRALQVWAPAPAADGSVPSLDAVEKAAPPAALTFSDAAEAGWRNFRHKLDHCVHYSECRLCELVTVLT